MAIERVERRWEGKSKKSKYLGWIDGAVRSGSASPIAEDELSLRRYKRGEHYSVPDRTMLIVGFICSA